MTGMVSLLTNQTNLSFCKRKKKKNGMSGAEKREKTAALMDLIESTQAVSKKSAASSVRSAAMNMVKKQGKPHPQKASSHSQKVSAHPQKVTSKKPCSQADKPAKAVKKTDIKSGNFLKAISRKNMNGQAHAYQSVLSAEGVDITYDGAKYSVKNDIQPQMLCDYAKPIMDKKEKILKRIEENGKDKKLKFTVAENNGPISRHYIYRPDKENIDRGYMRIEVPEEKIIMVFNRSLNKLETTYEFKTSKAVKKFQQEAADFLKIKEGEVDKDELDGLVKGAMEIKEDLNEAKIGISRKAAASALYEGLSAQDLTDYVYDNATREDNRHVKSCGKGRIRVYVKNPELEKTFRLIVDRTDYKYPNYIVAVDVNKDVDNSLQAATRQHQPSSA